MQVIAYFLFDSVTRPFIPEIPSGVWLRELLSQSRTEMPMKTERMAARVCVHLTARTM